MPAKAGKSAGKDVKPEAKQAETPDIAVPVSSFRGLKLNLKLQAIYEALLRIEGKL